MTTNLRCYFNSKLNIQQQKLEFYMSIVYNKYNNPSILVHVRQDPPRHKIAVLCPDFVVLL